MTAYSTPGVYRRPRPAQDTDIRLVRTDIAGFVGFAERGPLSLEGAEKIDPKKLAVRLTSWKEFVANFGGFIKYGWLAYAVRAFFQNGGLTCRVVRIATKDATYATPSVYNGSFSLRARSPGNWGNRIRLTFAPLESGDAIRKFSLRVRVEGAGRAEEEFYSRLSLDPDSYFAPDRINPFSNLIRLDLIEGVGEAALPLLFKNTPLERGPIQLQGGRDGLSGLTLQDFIGGADDMRGLRVLEEIDEVGILCAPDALFEPPAMLPKAKPQHPPCEPEPGAPPTDPVEDDPTAIPPLKNPRDQEADVARIYHAMLDQCERRRDRVALLDTPAGTRTTAGVLDWKTNFVSRFGALYFPWLKVPDALTLEGSTRRVPPSGHVAGIYARIDNEFGVHRPPANAALEFITDVVDEVTHLQQEELNPHGINAIRSFQNRGIRVWGARSLAGPGDFDWQFIHVRRLMSMIEESVDKSTQWAVFESNDFTLRRTLVHSLNVFLEAIWRKGGLKGALPKQGFYVKCDETNNPAAVVDAGRIVCEVGVAVAAPMEFIVFEIRQMAGGAQVIEP